MDLMLVASDTEFESTLQDVTVAPADSESLSVLTRDDRLARSGLLESSRNYAAAKPFPYHVGVSLLAFNDDWKVLEYPHKGFDAIALKDDDQEEENKKKKKKKKPTHTYFFEPDAEEKKGITAAELLGKKKPEKAAKAVKESAIFHAYNPAYSWKGGAEERICNRKRVAPPVHYPTAFRMLVSLNKLNLLSNTGTTLDFEPFFIELGLYDVKQKVRLSEIFHVNVNSEYALSLLGCNKEDVDATQINHALFSVSGDDINDSVCLVATVYKVLQGELDPHHRLYDKVTPKQLSKAMANSRVACKRYGVYRQLFAFGACTIFDSETLSFNENIKMNELFRNPRTDTALDTKVICDLIERWKFGGKNKLPSTPFPIRCDLKAQKLATERRRACEELREQGIVLLSSQLVDAHGDMNKLSGKLARLAAKDAQVEARGLEAAASGRRATTAEDQKGANVLQLSYHRRGPRGFSVVSDSNLETKVTIEEVDESKESEGVDTQPSESKLDVTQNADDEEDMKMDVAPDLKREKATPAASPSGRNMSVLSSVRIQPNASNRKGDRVSTAKSSFVACPQVPTFEERKAILGSVAANEPEKEEVEGEDGEDDSTKGKKDVVAAVNGADGNVCLAREITSFSLVEQPIFNLRYEHSLYVSPVSLGVDNFRNVTIRVQLRENDLLNDSDNLPAIYPHANAAGIQSPTLTAEYTAVSYHCKRPHFLQEFKIALPLTLRPTHHLFFTFLNVSCKAPSKKDKDEPIETVIGYSFLPLLQDHRPLDSSYTLPVFKSVSRQYLVKRDDPSNWMKNCPVFKVHTRLASSINASEPYLASFLKFATIEGLNDGKDPYVEPTDHVSRVLSQVLRSGQVKNHGKSWITLSRTALSVYRNPLHHDKPSQVFNLTQETEIGFPEPVGEGDSRVWVVSLINSTTNPNNNQPVRDVFELHCDTEIDAKSWSHAIYHARILTSKDVKVADDEGQVFTMARRIDSIRNITNTENTALVEFAPTVLRMLCEIMCIPDQPADVEGVTPPSLVEIKDQAFRTLLAVVARMAEENMAQDRNMAMDDRAPYLDKFARYIFDEWHIVDNPTHLRLYEALPVLWSRFLTSVEENSDLRKQAATYSWFMFDMMVKSMSLHVATFSTKDDSKQEEKGDSMYRLHNLALKSNFYKAETTTAMQGLVEQLGHEINYFTTYQLSTGRQLNQHLALFFSDCIYLWKRVDLFDLMAVYLSHCGMDENTVLLQNRFTFLEILCDHENLVPFSWTEDIAGLARKYLHVSQIDPELATTEGLDVVLTREKSSTVITRGERRGSLEGKTTGMEEYQEKELRAINHIRRRKDLDNAIFSHTIVGIPDKGHFLPLVLIHELFLSFRVDAREMILAKAAIIVRNVLTKHEFDMRYQDTKRRAHIATMYLPLLDCLWYNLPHLKSLFSTGVKKDIMSCIVYVLRNVPPNIIIHFYKERLKDPDVVQQWLHSFQEILLECLNVFEYTGNGTTSKSVIAPEAASNISRQNGAGGNNATMMIGSGRFGSKRDSLRGSLVSTSAASSNPLAQLEAMNKRREGKTARSRLQARRDYSGGTLTKTLTKDQMEALQAAGAKNVTSNGPGLRNKLVAHRTWKGGDMTAQIGVANFNGLWAAERLWSAEVTRTVLNILEHVVVPLCDKTLRTHPRVQAIFLRFLHRVLTKNQADELVRHTFKTYTKLLESYSSLLWSQPKLDGERCVPWWFELVRHMTFKHEETRDSAVAFILELLKHTAQNNNGSITRSRIPFLDGFAAVFDMIRDVIAPKPQNEKLDAERKAGEIVNEKDAKKMSVVSLSQKTEDNFEEYARAPTRGQSATWNLTATPLMTMNGIRTLKSTPEDQATRPSIDRANSAQGLYENQMDVKTMEAKYEHRTEIQKAVIDNTDDALHKDRIAHLVKGIQSLETMAANGDKKLAEQVLEHCETMRAIIKLSALIHNPSLQQRMEPTMLVELIYEMIEHYKTVPRMQIRYLKAAYDVYVRIGRLPEAAAVQIRMADLIEEQIKSKPLFKCHYWDPVYFEGCLHAASVLYEDANWYEEAVNCEHRLVEHFKKKHNYAGDLPRIVACHERLLAIYKLLAEWAEKGDARAFGRYYRVGFHGKDFDDPDYGGRLFMKEYIYREPKFTQLSEISSRLRKFYSLAFKKDVQLFKDSNMPSEDVSNGEIPMIQVTACIISFDHDEKGTLRENHYHKSKNLRDFVYDTPFTKSGKAHGTTTTQYKRKTQLRTDSFPSTLCRHPIIQREEHVLNPIQCVLEDITKRVKTLQAMVHPEAGEPDPKTLNQVLSGSVNMQVHGGAEEVCMAFLHPDEIDKYDQQDISQLRKLLARFLELCGEGLDYTRTKTGTSDALLQFQELLDGGYANLMGKVRSLVFPEEAEKAKKTAPTGEDDATTKE